MSNAVSSTVLELKTDGTQFNKGVDEADEKSENLGKTLERIAKELGNVGKQIDSAGQNLGKMGKQAEESAKTSASAMNGLSSTVTKVGAAMAAAFTVTAIVGAAKQVIDYAGNVADLAKKLDISTDAVQTWEAAFGASGVSLEDAAKASQKLTENLVGGDKNAVAALQKLGFSVDELRAMNPEERFIKVADAIGNIQDSGERLYASKAILGKGGTELLAALDGHLAETITKLKEMGVVIDEETIRAADDFGDQIGIIGKQLMALGGEVLRPLLPLLTALANGLIAAWQVIAKVLTPAVQYFTMGILLTARAIVEFLAYVADLATKIPLLGKHLGFAGDAAKYLHEKGAALTKTMEQLVNPTADLANTAEKKTKPALLGLGKAAEDAEEKHKKLAAAIVALESRVGGLKDALKDLAEVSTTEVAPVYNDLLDKVHAMEARVGGLKDALKDLAEVSTTEAAPATKKLRDETKAFGEDLGNLASAFSQLAQVSGDAWDGIAQDIGGVFTAADTVFKALVGWDSKSAIGKLAGVAAAYAAIAQAASQGGGGVWGGVARGAASGALAGSAVPGLGTVGGAAVGAIVGGASAAVAAAQKEEDDHKAGRKARDAYMKGFAELGTDPTQQLMAGATELYERWVKAGGGVARFNELLNESTMSSEEVAMRMQEITDKIDFQDQSMATLAQTAQKYGLTIEELGPAWTKQELDKKSQELYQDWTLLIGAGADIHAVAEKMGPAMSEFVNQSVAAGQEIPAAMKPIVDQMIAQGSLLDSNGKAITDSEAAGISYSETMTQGFAKVVKSVDRMVSAIAKVLGITIDLDDQTDDTTNNVKRAYAGVADVISNDVPDAIDVAWTEMQRAFGEDIPDVISTSIDRMGDLGAAILALPDGEIAINMTRTGDAGAFSAIPMADGGFGEVRRPTYFLAGEDGPEQFAFSGAGKRFGAGGAGADGGGGTVIIHLDGREIARAQLPYLYDTVHAYGAGK